MNGAADINVTAFSPRYLVAYSRVERIEGGFVNDPRDHGGATKYGVSLRFLATEGKIDLDADGVADFDLDLDGDIDINDVRRLTPADARYLFHRCFWLRMACETLPYPLGEAMFDQSVNGGISAARKILQRALRRVTGSSIKDDGFIGPATLSAQRIVLARTGNAGLRALIAAYRVEAAERYKGIVARDPSQAKYLKGWLRRAAELGQA